MSGVGALADEKYISLTTFKLDGTPVATRLGRQRRRAAVARMDWPADLEGETAASQSSRDRHGVGLPRPDAR